MIEGRKAKRKAARERFRRWLERQRERIVRETRVGMPSIKAVIALSVLALAGCTETDRRLARETQQKIEQAAQLHNMGFSAAGILFHMFPAARAQQPSGGGGGGGGGGGNYRAPTTVLPSGVAFSTLTGLFTGSPFTPTLPANWNGTVTHRPADGTALNAVFAGTPVRGTTIIELTPGVVYQAPTGSWSINAFSGSSGVVILRTGTAGGSMQNLPAFGSRVTAAANGADMAIIRAANLLNERALKIGGATGLGHIHIAGIRFQGPTGANSAQLIEMGGNLDNTALHPSNVTFDRCTIEGDDTRDHRRGLQFHVNGGALIGTSITGCTDRGSDSQALAMWHCVGNIHVENCLLEGAGENMMVGGATASTPAATVQPSNILFYRNEFRKPIAWKGTSIIVKNIWEVKFGNSIAAIANSLHGSWMGFGQYASAFNVKTSVDAAHLAAYDITMRYNKVYNVGIVLTMNTGEAGASITPILLKKIDFSDNLGYSINTATYSTTLASAFYSSHTFGGAIDDLSIDHNTIVAGPGGVTSIYTMTGDRNAGQNGGLRGLFSNNLLECGTGGANLTGIRWGTEGSVSLAMMMDSATATVRNNAMLNRAAVSAQYTGMGTAWQFPTVATVGFADYANGDYRITGGTALNAGSDGRSIGADVSLINTLTAGIESP